MRFRMPAAGLSLLWSCVAAGQSLNVDFGGTVAPSDDHAAAGHSGVWNSVPATFLVPDVLFGLNGQPTDIQLTIFPAGPPSITIPDPGTVGDDELLLDDLITNSDGGFLDLIVDLTGLENGPYRAIGYAWTPNTQFATDAQSLVGITNNNEQLFGLFSVGGPWPGAIAEGVTHRSRSLFVVDGTLTFQFVGPCFGECARSNGIQLVRIEPTADIDEDGFVTLADFATFAACVTGPVAENDDAACAAFDLDEDGHIDLADFGAVQNLFGGPA